MNTLPETTPVPVSLASIPTNEKEAVQWLLPLVRAADGHTLPDVGRDDFRRGWYAVGFLYPDLYPNHLWEENTYVSHETPDRPGLSNADPRLVKPFYEPSGWPLVLVPVVSEAWRRYEAGELKWRELYCKDALLAGAGHRSPEVTPRMQLEHEPLV